MTKVISFLGGTTVRGSSSRGAVSGLKALLTALKKSEYNASFAVDGPRGPIYQVKPGIFLVQDFFSERPAILAAGVAVSSAWVFKKSWNQALLPKPFAKVVIHWMPFNVENENDTYDKKCLLLGEALQKSSEEARKILESKF